MSSLLDALRTEIQPNPLPQWEQLWRSEQPFKWFCGGYGSGKTTLGVVEAFLNATVRHPGYVGIVAAPTYPLLWQAWFAEWVKWFAPFRGLWELKQHPKEGDSLVFSNGSKILLRSTSVPASNEGINAAWLIFDEATRERGHDSYNVLVSRVRRGYPGRQRTVLLLGPPNTRAHWTAREYGYGSGVCVHDGKSTSYSGDSSQWHGQNTTVVRARTADNPFLPPDYEPGLRSRPGATASWCKQFLDAQFGAIEGAVWPQFSRDKHVVKASRIAQLARTWRRVKVGVDWGWTHPGAMIVLAQDGYGNAYAIAEEVHSGKLVADTPEGWIPIARTLCRDHLATEFHCDPSAPGNMTALSQGLRGLARVYPADNDVGEGIRRVGARFEAVDAAGEQPVTRALYVSDACPILIDKIEGYGRKRTAQGALTEAPQEIDDDPCDGLRYGVMGLAA